MLTGEDARILINTGPSERGWHRLECAMRCMRLYAFKYLLKLDDGSREPLVRGSLCHIGAAHFYAQMRAVQQGADPGRYYDPLDAIEKAAPLFGPVGIGLKDKCQAIIGQYMKYRASDAANFTILEVEEKVRAMMNGKWLFTQRWDLLVRERTGILYIIDHKTSARPSASTHGRYALSGQFLGAHKIAKARFGDQFGGVKVNVMGATEPYKFERSNLPMVPEAWERFSDDACEIEERLAAYEKEGRDPWKYPGAWNEHACQTAYGACGMFTLCQWGKSRL